MAHAARLVTVPKDPDATEPAPPLPPLAPPPLGSHPRANDRPPRWGVSARGHRLRRPGRPLEERGDASEVFPLEVADRGTNTSRRADGGAPSVT